MGYITIKKLVDYNELFHVKTCICLILTEYENVMHTVEKRDTCTLF